MPPSRLDIASRTFQATAEALHDKFLVAISDPACVECPAAGFSGAVFTAWLQEEWSNFLRNLIIASALGTRRKSGASVRAIRGVSNRPNAEKIVNGAAKSVAKHRGLQQPVWHAPEFVIEVSNYVRLANFATIEATLSPTRVPQQLTVFRNYLVHPSDRNRIKYQKLQAEFGLLDIEPQDFVYRHRSRGVPVFTSWVRELQSIAHASTR